MVERAFPCRDLAIAKPCRHRLLAASWRGLVQPEPRIALRIATEERDSVLSELENAGIDASASPRRADRVLFNITRQGVEQHAPLIRKVLKSAEATASRVV